MTRYTRDQLVRHFISDLVIEVRTSERRSGGTNDYSTFCRKQISNVFRARHTTRLDAFGYPEVLNGAPPAERAKARP